jgi:DNA-binding HxlR family transcriptional regulator
MTQTLKVLVRDGLIARIERATVPPQVTYELSPVGRDLGARHCAKSFSAWVAGSAIS